MKPTNFDGPDEESANADQKEFDAHMLQNFEAHMAGLKELMAIAAERNPKIRAAIEAAKVAANNCDNGTM